MYLMHSDKALASSLPLSEARNKNNSPTESVSRVSPHQRNEWDLQILKLYHALMVLNSR